MTLEAPPVGLMPKDTRFQSILLGKLVPFADDCNFWGNIEGLMKRKYASTHASRFYPIDQRIAMLKMTMSCSMDTIAETFNVPMSTCYNVVNEGLAAAVFTLGRDNSIYPHEQLDQYGSEQFAKFEQHEKKRAAIIASLENDEMQALLADFHPLRTLIDYFLAEGEVKTYLGEIGVRPIKRAINSYFYRYIAEGDTTVGILALLRRCLYQSWLHQKRLYHTPHGVIVSNMLASAAETALLPKLTGEDKEAANQVAMFLSYLMVLDLDLYLKNHSVTDEEFAGLFFAGNSAGQNSVTRSFERSRLNETGILRLTNIGAIDAGNRRLRVTLDPLKYYQANREGPAPHALIEHARRVMSTRTTQPIVDDIAQLMNIDPFQARKVFEKGQNIIDLMLLQQNPNDISVSIRELRNNPLFLRYNQFASLTKNRSRSAS